MKFCCKFRKNRLGLIGVFSNLVSIVIGGIFLGSCDRVIDLPIKNAEENYVIEGVVSNDREGAVVRISTIRNFSDTSGMNGVSGAKVYIETKGRRYELKESTQGFYRAKTLVGISRYTYNLSVNINGKIYSAKSTMPKPVKFIEPRLLTNINLFDKQKTERKFVVVRYNDPSNEQNNYRFVQYVNGNKEPSIFVTNDETTQGEYVEFTLAYGNENDDPKREINIGDNIRIEVLNIDANIYKFWYSLKNAGSGDSNNASPSNPPTNIEGGALGYFSAEYKQTQSFEIP